MDQEQKPPTPNDLLIASETTGLDVEPRPPGCRDPQSELVLSLAMTECHTWVGIGGRSGRVRRPRRLSREIPVAPDNLGSDDDCRRHIGWAIKDSLSEEEEYRCLTPAHWDEAVPLGVERALAEAVQRVGGGAFDATVDIRVRFEFVYSEPEALLLACAENDGGGTAGRSGNNDGGDGEAPSCSICFEEMWREAGEVTDLPGCTHGFHPWCIAAWFDKASTCPVCRRDQLQYLPPDYWDLHDSMTTDPDSLPDYL